MAKRKVVWSEQAKINLRKILTFFDERNNSKVYSKKLFSKINKELEFLIKHPDLGIKTGIDSVRSFIIEDYIVFYELVEDIIFILDFWDSKQNPDNLKNKIGFCILKSTSK